MEKGRRGGPSRLDKRREAEAYEKRQEDEEVEEVEGEEDEEAEDEEADADAEVDAEVDAEADADLDVADEGDEGDEGDEDRPKKKAKKAVKKPAAKKATTKRSRAAKEVRTRAVWVVYDNGNKVVEKFPYNQKADAEALLAKKMEEKKGTFYINMVKEEIKE
jgi:hypothetical protein